MPAYRWIFTRPSGGQSSKALQFANDWLAIDCAKLQLSAEVISVAVGRGEIVCETEWLGVWDFDGGKPVWTPDGET